MILKNINNCNFKLRNAKIRRICLYEVTDKSNPRYYNTKQYCVSAPSIYDEKRYGITEDFNNIELGEIEKCTEWSAHDGMQKMNNFYHANWLYLYLDGVNVKREFVGRIADGGVWVDKYKVTIYGHEYEYEDWDHQTPFYTQEEMTIQTIADNIKYKCEFCVDNNDIRSVIKALQKEYDITPKWFIEKMKSA